MTALRSARWLLRAMAERLARGRPVIARPGMRVARFDGHAFASEQDLECPPGIPNRDDMLSIAFKFVYSNRIAGDYFEFGSYTGRTFRMAYTHSRRPYVRETAEFEQPIHLWAFDSFEGLPEPSEVDRFPRWERGAMQTTLHEFHAALDAWGVARDAYTVIPGFYEDTLTPELKTRMQGVRAAVAYIDCDFYSSTATVLRFLPPFLRAGSILCFDDYYAYRGSVSHGAQRAIAEFLSEHTHLQLHPWYRFGWGGRSFIVRLDHEPD